MSESYIDDMEDVVSACCKVPVVNDGAKPICTSCRRSCDLMVTCQRCKGTGEYYNGFEMNGCDCENGYIYLED